MSVSLDLRISFCLLPIELPVFNPVALELLQLLGDPSTEIDAIVDTINNDQALSAQVLKMANSAAFSGLIHSETIKDSAVRLGTRQITNLAMAASQAALHTSDNPIVNDIMQDLWLHSHACALGCRALALKTGHQGLADQAYMAGLLHDIGKLYILKAMERINQDMESGIVLERSLILGVFSGMHVELGCRLMDYWNIPPVYRAIVANHHSEHVDSQDLLLAIVRLVNLNSRRLHLSLNPAVIQEEDMLPESSALRMNESVWAKLEETMIGAGKTDSELLPQAGAISRGERCS
jgi:putative nucleotidyltransferase with HDIG domain